MANAFSQFQQNSSVFYFQKGKALNDSRQVEGLAHELEISVSKLIFKVGVPQKIQVCWRNFGSTLNFPTWNLFAQIRPRF